MEGRIIKITENTVLIGFDDSSIEEFNKDDLNFEPSLGVEVLIYGNENQKIVTMKEVKNNVGNEKDNVNNLKKDKKVNKIVYVLLALILGGVGIHKFYAGKLFQGILYVLFSWTLIPAIVAFIEAIIALSKQPDSNGDIIV